jgi:NAD(P)-dependent dehydrogenase (short-subunit alcohol dehydrogenase family)
VAREIGGLGLVCDVTSAAAAEAAVERARAVHGPARLLVNCAGIAPGKRIVGRDGAMALEDFERVIRVNLIGSFNLLRLAAADMVDAEPLADGERGVIVSTASVAAVEGQVGQAAYSASKAGIVGMMLPAARELARYGIRVLTIAGGPGWPGRPGALPQAPRQARGICPAGPAHCRQCPAERRGDPARRCASHAVTQAVKHPT